MYTLMALDFATLQYTEYKDIKLYNVKEKCLWTQTFGTPYIYTNLQDDYLCCYPTKSFHFKGLECEFPPDTKQISTSSI